MIEILITLLIVILAGYIIIRSIKNSSKGKCNGGCSKCPSKSKCHENHDKN